MDLINKMNGKDLSNEMSPTDATALLLRLDPSKYQYQTIRKESSASKLHFLPPYTHVQEEKEDIAIKHQDYRNLCPSAFKEFEDQDLSQQYE